MVPSTRKLLTLVIVGIAATIYIYPLTLRTPLIDPDEGMHAAIAQDMVERGDYVIPRYCGEPFRDKPFLYFAAEALSLRTFGMNEAAVRLPGMLFALLGCFTTAVLAWRFYNKDCAIYTCLVSLTLVVPLIVAQSPIHDIALVPALNCVVLCFWEQEKAISAKSRIAWLVGGAMSIGFAILTKGLIGIALIAGGLAIYTAMTKAFSWQLAARYAFVLVMGAALAAPWFVAMEHASPGYLQYYFIDRHFWGFASHSQEHGAAPWYYYFAPVIGGGMPWTLFATAMILQLRHDKVRSTRAKPTLLLLCWFVGGFLFLNIAGSKLLTYSLPLFPPVAILAAVAFSRFFEGSLAPSGRRIVNATFCCSCILGLIAPVTTLAILGKFVNAPSPFVAYLVAALASVIMVFALLLFARKRSETALAVGMLWFPIVFVAVMTWPVQAVADRHSQRSLATEISGLRGMPHQMVLIGERVGSIMFYLSRDCRLSLRDGGIREIHAKEFDNLTGLPPNTLLVVSNKEKHRWPGASAVANAYQAERGNYYIAKLYTVTTSRGSQSVRGGEK